MATAAGRAESSPSSSARPAGFVSFGKASKFRASAGEGELYLYDEIGGGPFGGISAKDVADALQELRDCTSLRVMLSSPGGDVFEGLAIYNLLLRHPAAKTCMIDGVAASIASVIALACDRRITASNATWMIHEAHANGASGDADDLTGLAERLKMISEQMAVTYAERTGNSLVACRAWMAETKWMTADEAKTLGFSHETTGEGDRESVVLHASALGRFGSLPPAVRAHLQSPPVAQTASVVSSPSPAGGTHAKETPMLKLIVAHMGLPATTTEAEALSALADLTGKVKALTTEKETLVAKAVELTGQISAMKVAAESREVDALLASAETEGRLTPAQTKELRDAKLSAAFVKSFVEKSPKTALSARATPEATTPVSTVSVTDGEKRNLTLVSGVNADDYAKHKAKLIANGTIRA